MAATGPRAERRPFGLDWMRRYLPHYLTAPPNRLHRDLAADLAGLHERRGEWRVYEAPRGSAKSTWLSKGYPLWCAVERAEVYTLLLSDTGDQAGEFLDAVKQELEGNPRLAADYPEACGVGPVWRGDRVRLRNGCQIVAKGSGSRVRGRSNRNARPSLVVVDDANEKDDAHSPTLRRRKWDWFTKDVMPVGTARTNVLVAGTPIHREAVSRRLRTAAGWHARGYKAVERWPARTDLWAEWELKLYDLADPDRVGTARRFYEANRAEMDRGAEVFWPEWEPLYGLMTLRAAIGPAAFGSEKQDQPGGDGASEWPPDWFDRADLWFDRWPELVDVGGRPALVQALDPSQGADARTGADRGRDFQAHVRAGVGRDGLVYVEADLRREDPTAMCGRALDWAGEMPPAEVRVEDNGTMGLIDVEFDRQLADRAKAGRPQLTRVVFFTSRDAKADRVRAAGGYLSRGQIRVRNTPGGRALVDQWRDWPTGEFDDGPDAAGVAIRRLETLIHEGR